MTYKSYKDAQPGDTIARCKIPLAGEGVYLIKRSYEYFCGNRDDSACCSLFDDENCCKITSNLCRHDIYFTKVDE